MDKILPLDIVLSLFPLFKKEHEFLWLLSVNKLYNELKTKVFFKQIVHYTPKIKEIFYYKQLNLFYIAYIENQWYIPEHIKALKCDHINPNAIVPLEPGDIPNSVFYLDLGFYYDHPLKPGDIPNSVRSLVLGSRFSQQIKEGDIPNSVRTLTIYSHFRAYCIAKSFIPSSITKLIFGRDFSTNFVRLNIPHTIKTVVFGDYFNKDLNIGDIPPSVHTLEFGSQYNKRFLEGVIPPSVKTIILPKSYMYPVPKNSNRVIIHKN